MNDKEKRLVDISTLARVSVWLRALPITEFEFELSKQQFWDSIRLRYGWENMQSTNILLVVVNLVFSNLATSCPCGSKFDIQQSTNILPLR